MLIQFRVENHRSLRDEQILSLTASSDKAGEHVRDVERTPHDPFRLSSKAREPSLYEVDIVVDGVRFRYGFQLSAVRIEEEWLFAWPHGRHVPGYDKELELAKLQPGYEDAVRRARQLDDDVLRADRIGRIQPRASTCSPR